MILSTSGRVDNAEENKALTEDETKQLSMLLNTADYLGLLVFLEKFSVPLGLYEYSLRSLETGIISNEEVFISLGMQELHFQFLKRIHVCRSITRNKVLKFISKFANTYGLSHIADKLDKSECYESLSPETRMLLLKTVVDCQLDENNRLRTFLNEQPSDFVRSVPLGKDKNGIGYWFFEDAEYSVRLFNEDLTIEQRPIKLIASNIQGVLSTIEKLVADVQLQTKFNGWIPDGLRDSSIVNVLIENIILQAVSITESTMQKEDHIKKSLPRRSRRRNPKRNTALNHHLKESSDTETGDITDKDFIPDEHASRNVKRNGMSYDTNCRKCNNPYSEDIVLLCDECNDPYHPGCLFPPLIDIPEGDWFCPICEQKKLCQILSMRIGVILSAIDEEERKKAASALARQNRLANIQANIDNLIIQAQITSNKSVKVKAQIESSSDNTDSFSERSDVADQFDTNRIRRARGNVNYRFDDYDAALKEAIGDVSSESENQSAVININRKGSIDRDFENESRSCQSSRSSISQEEFDKDQWSPMYQRTKRAKRVHHTTNKNSHSSDDWKAPMRKPKTSRNQPVRRSARKAAQNRRSYYDDLESNESSSSSSDESIELKHQTPNYSIRQRIARALVESSTPSNSSQADNSPNDEDDEDDLLWKRRMQLNKYSENSKDVNKLLQQNRELNEKQSVPLNKEPLTSHCITVQRYVMPEKKACSNIKGVPTNNLISESTIINPLSSPVSLLSQLNNTLYRAPSDLDHSFTNSTSNFMRPRSLAASNFNTSRNANAGTTTLKGYIPRAIRCTPFVLSETSYTLCSDLTDQQLSAKETDEKMSCQDLECANDKDDADISNYTNNKGSKFIVNDHNSTNV